MSRAENKRSKKNKKLKIVLLSLAFILLFGLGAGGFYLSTLMNKVNVEKISEKPEELGINEDLEQQLEESGKNNVTNIALFGLDQRNIKERGRSDSIMILTVDKEHKKIKLSSIMRDSYVDIDGHGKDKITHAYAFGGPQLAVKTINENFNLNIKSYVTVNFFGLAKIIDVMGGVTIDVKASEVPVANNYVKEIAKLENVDPPLIKGPGKQVLNGIQAVSYARNRYTGNGDYERTDRQRRVLSALMEKVKVLGVTKYPSVVSELLPYVLTNMSSVDIVKMGKDVLTSGTTNIGQERFPIDGYCVGKKINGVYYLTYDEAATKDQMYKFIFEDIKPTAKK
jgi:polyisoprenyl-teichoic acid--peptidoglycan teichoic acid transferase